MDDRMTITEISRIGDALFYLSGLTQRRWTEEEFAREVNRLRLPIYAVAPQGATVVRRERIDGKQVITPQPDLRAGYVTLLQDEFEQLNRGGQTITDRPAWVFGDAPYHSWSEIEAHRAANHRVVSNWDVDSGEWMGESDIYFFADLIGVTPDTELVVPRHTIAEIARAAAALGCQQPSLETAQEVIGGGVEQKEVSGTEANCGPADDVNRARMGANNWDNHGLRRLLEESRMPGSTQMALGTKYGVSRQFIGKQLTKAKQLFERQKASPFDGLNTRGKK
jgi:hypothetical protein